MKKISKVAAMLLCLLITIQGISANPEYEAKHYAYWHKVHSDIHRPYDEETTIEYGWNQYLKSLVDPVYEEARNEFDSIHTMDSSSEKLEVQYNYYDRYDKEFDFILYLDTGYRTIRYDIPVPYSKLTGTPWTDDEYCRRNIDQLDTAFRNNSSRMLARITYHLTYDERSSYCTLTTDSMEVVDRKTGAKVYTNTNPGREDEFPLYGDLSEFAGNVPFRKDILDRDIYYEVDDYSYKHTSNPFGMSLSYSELNAEMDGIMIKETEAEIERLHEEEREKVSILEEQMREEALSHELDKVRKAEERQKQEDQKQKEYDDAFNAEALKITSRKPKTIKIYNEILKETAYSYNTSYQFGVGSPFGITGGESYRPELNLYGVFQCNLSRNGGRNHGYANSVYLDVALSGALSNLIGENEDLDMEPIDASDVFAIYAGLGPSFGNRYVTFLVSGGLSGGYVELRPEGYYPHLEPGIRMSLTLQPWTVPMGLTVALQAQDTSIQLSANLSIVL